MPETPQPPREDQPKPAQNRPQEPAPGPEPDAPHPGMAMFPPGIIPPGAVPPEAFGGHPPPNAMIPPGGLPEAPFVWVPVLLPLSGPPLTPAQARRMQQAQRRQSAATRAPGMEPTGGDTAAATAAGTTADTAGASSGGVDYSQLAREAFTRQIPPSPEAKEPSSREPVSRGFKPIYLFIALSTFALVLASLAIISVLQQREGPQATAEAPTPTEEAAGTPVDQLSPQLLADAFCAANGGRNAMEQARTLMLSGDFRTPDASYAFYSLKKRPGRMYLRLEGPSGHIIYGVTPDETWQMVQDPQGRQRLVGDVEASQEASLHEMSRFFHPFTEFCLSGKGTVESIKNALFENEEALEIVFQPQSMDRYYTVFVDQRNYRLLSSVYINPVSGQTVQSIYSNYQQVGSLWLPFLVETYTDGQLTSEATITESKFNPGLVNVVFERPEGTGNLDELRNNAPETTP